jgi:hypothetical protein
VTEYSLFLFKKVFAKWRKFATKNEIKSLDRYLPTYLALFTHQSNPTGSRVDVVGAVGS